MEQNVVLAAGDEPLAWASDRKCPANMGRATTRWPVCASEPTTRVKFSGSKKVRLPEGGDQGDEDERCQAGQQIQEHAPERPRPPGGGR